MRPNKIQCTLQMLDTQLMFQKVSTNQSGLLRGRSASVTTHRPHTALLNKEDRNLKLLFRRAEQTNARCKASASGRGSKSFVWFGINQGGGRDRAIATMHSARRH